MTTPTEPSAEAVMERLRANMPFASHHGLDCDTPMPATRISLAELDVLRRDREAMQKALEAADRMAEEASYLRTWLASALKCEAFKWDDDQGRAAGECVAGYDKAAGVYSALRKGEGT